MVIDTASISNAVFEEISRKVTSGDVFTERELLSYTKQLIESNHECTRPTHEGYPFTVIGYDFNSGKTFMMRTFAEDSLNATVNVIDSIPCTVNSHTLQAHLPEGLIYIPGVS